MSDFESRARKASESVRNQIDENAPTPREPRKSSVLKTAGPSTLLVLALIGAGLFAIGHHDSSSSPSFKLAGLQTFDKCDAALTYFHQQAPQYYLDQLKNGGRVEPATAGPEFNAPPLTTTIPSSASPSVGNKSSTDAPNYSDIHPDQGALPGGATSTDSVFSTTNVQEKGVDEPDTIKTDGKAVVTVANNGNVYLLAANGGSPQLKAKLAETGITGVLLSGTHLVLLQDDGSNRVVVISYDISDLAHPVNKGAISEQGSLIDARMVGTQVRFATTFTPDPNIPSPTYNDNGDVTQASKDALPGQVAATTLKDWSPQYELINDNGSVINSGSVVPCANLSHPAKFSGLNTVALTTFDITNVPNIQHVVGVIGNGSQLYATAANTYLSSTDYSNNGSAATHTDIHKFTTAPDGTSKYEGSGVVDGALLSSYSMSESGSVLRVATTSSGSRGWINQHTVTEGLVTTLQPKGNTLVQLGQLSGLGKQDNESITAVRFVGNRGYVSTARQTDPLFVIDLTDAANPKLTGQLKVPGFSAYLEPLANNLILAVGQSSTNDVILPESPRTTVTGMGGPQMGISSPAWCCGNGGSKLQFSLYDVNDPTNPKQVGQIQYGNGTAASQFDPHAFLYWQPRNLVVAPATVYGIDGLDQFTGLLLMQADGKTLKEIGRLADTESNAKYSGSQVTRTIVIDNNIYMLSTDNLQVDSLDTHKQVSTVALTN